MFNFRETRDVFWSNLHRPGEEENPYLEVAGCLKSLETSEEWAMQRL